MTIPYAVDYAGSSFTSAAVIGYAPVSQAWMLINKQEYLFTFRNQAVGGHNTWSNLVRLTTGADLFIIDHANDSKDLDYASMEALIRVLWATKPSAKIIMVSSPSWNGIDIDVDDNVNHPGNETQLALYEAFAAYYGIPWVDYWGWCKTVVNAGTYHLNQLTDDTVHPNALGYSNMAILLENYLPTGGASCPSLPARLYDDGSYENTPTRTVGTGYDSKTGTWSESGTQIASTEAGATVTFSATCKSYGLYRADGTGNPSLEVSVDGGAFAALAVNQNGIALASRTVHTFIFKVISGSVEIDEFWTV